MYNRGCSFINRSMGNSFSPINSFCTLSAFDLSQTVFLAALNYQVDHMYDTGKIVFPTWPEVTKKIARFCSTILGISRMGGLIMESPSSIYVVFRGTKSVLEGITDARGVIKTKFELIPNGGEVHRGFYELYKTTRDKIMNKLNSLDVNKQLYIVGHSLGGALATQCALDVAVNSKFKQPTLCTFGSPRVGDEAFVNRFDTTINTSVRVDNEYDWVPDVPPEVAGYKHVKGVFMIYVDNGPEVEGGSFRNHLLNTAYFPGLAAIYPEYAKQVCDNNPPGFCP